MRWEVVRVLRTGEWRNLTMFDRITLVAVLKTD